MKRTAPICPIALAFACSGCAFSKLGSDLARLEDEAHLFTGFVSSEALEIHSTVVVAMDDPVAEVIVSFRMMSGDGVFELRLPKGPSWFFAFADLNKDLRFQEDEPYGWAGRGDAIDSGSGDTIGVDIVIGAAGLHITDRRARPVWNDLYPESDYVSTLFDTPLPENVPHNLIFGFRQDSIFGSGSSDGVIELSSQLRDAAQEQAVSVRGFDEGHVSILHSDAVIGNVYSLLDLAAR